MTQSYGERIRQPQLDVAIAHDYITQRGGAEKVLLAIHRGFRTAPIYTTLYQPSGSYPEFEGMDIRTSWLNLFPLLRRWHRLALPLLPFASHSMRIVASNTIVSSSGWAHGFRASGRKIVYCYSPARWLYQTDVYLGRESSALKRLAIRLLGPYLRRWDKRQAMTADKYFAISTSVRARIWAAYGIDAEVLPAPHSIEVDLPAEPVDVAPLAATDFYLCISRLLPYKNVSSIVSAFNQSRLPLVVVGSGPEEGRLRNASKGNIVFFKDLTDGQIRWLYSNCRAVVAASYEDFGLTPLEAAAFGKPSVALRWGGFLDTIREGETGVLFDEPRPDLIATAVDELSRMQWDADVLKRHASTFSEDRFVARLRAELTCGTAPRS